MLFFGLFPVLSGVTRDHKPRVRRIASSWRARRAVGGAKVVRAALTLFGLPAAGGGDWVPHGSRIGMVTIEVGPLAWRGSAM